MAFLSYSLQVFVAFSFLLSFYCFIDSPLNVDFFFLDCGLAISIICSAYSLHIQCENNTIGKI